MTTQGSAASEGGSTTTTERPETARPVVRHLPPWRVLLHNDDFNDMQTVVEAIVQLTVLARPQAVDRMLEAHRSGLTLLLCTHREHAELLEEQFRSKRLKVTIEPDK